VRWAHAEDVNGEQVNPGRPTALFVHGAGESSMSWTMTVKALKHGGRSPVNLIAMDVRGHGKSVSTDESLDKDVLVDDVLRLLRKLGCKDVYLIGHSMGGAIATWVAKKVVDEKCELNVKGLFVMDIVEELALHSISSTRKFIENRPTHFSSQEEVVQWEISHGMLRNVESARYSVSGKVKFENDKVVWRTDLLKSINSWPGWFIGLSDAFTVLPILNKTLLLAGTDRLDKSMMIGQMQGKFKLIVFPEVQVGHFVHEDASERTARCLEEFFNRMTTLPRGFGAQ